MNRRSFIRFTAAVSLTPGFALAARQSMLEYKPGLVEEQLAMGKTLLVDYTVDWCSTCRRQKRILGKLRKSNAAYDEHITFVRVDWDEFATSEVATSRNIPSRSTLVLLRGDDELGRIVAGTRKNDIKALLDKALPASR